MANKPNDIQTPIHPGEILKDEFLDAMQISEYRLAKDLHVQQTRINQIVNGRRSITADTAMRLARYFGTTAEFWLNLQMRYDLDVAQDAAAGRIDREVAKRTS